MLDIKYIIDNIDEVKEKLQFRLDDFNKLDELPLLYNERRDLIKEVESKKAFRNEKSKSIGLLKREGKDVSSVLKEVEEIGSVIKELDNTLSIIDTKIYNIMSNIPNIPDDSVPIGMDEESNLEIRKYLEPTKFDFKIKDHVELGENLDILDFERASKVAGARFVVNKGLGARLVRSLIQFMTDLHTFEHGYLECIPPYIVNASSLYATGQLPKFESDLFKLRGENNWYLNPTAEVPTISMHRDEIIDFENLPIKYTSYTTAFRSEAGSAGRDTRGILRQHQFDKVELIALSKPEDSSNLHEEMINHSEEVLKRLKLPYRTVVLSSGDMGFGMAKTYDIEVWIPSQNKYREIGSISNAKDFQARRGNIRFKRTKDGKTEYVHTLNGSGLAVGRTIIAIMENYQNKDGSITIPDVLIPYMKVDKITK